MINKRGKLDLTHILLISAIVVSIITTFIALNQVNLMRITGWQTYTPTTVGQINITINQNLTIYFTNYNMSFGSGAIVASKNSTTLNSSMPTFNTVNTSILTAANWTNTSDFRPSRFTLRNDGNVNASIALTSSKTAATFIGGTGPSFQFNVSQKEANSCNNGGTIAAFTEVSGASQDACTNLGAWDTRDELYVDVLIVIPSDASGDKEAFFTFAGTAVT